MDGNLGSGNGATSQHGLMGGRGGAKHFKKSMIFEFERIESERTEEDSQSSTASGRSDASKHEKSSTTMTKQHATNTTIAPDDTDNNSNDYSLTKLVNESRQVITASTVDDNKNNINLYEHQNRKRKHEQHNEEDDDDDDYDDDDDDDDDDEDDDHHDLKEKKSNRDESSSKKHTKEHSKKKKLNKSSESGGKNSSSGEGQPKKEKKVYCICKSTDTKRFMIACDKCDEWYHGNCVGVKESLSKKIKTFYCHICRNKMSGLAIKYVSKFRPLARELNDSSVDPAKLEGSRLQFYKETQIRLKRESELLKSGQKYDSKSSTSKHVTGKSHSSKSSSSKHTSNPKESHHHHHHSKSHFEHQLTINPKVESSKDPKSEPERQSLFNFDTANLSSKCYGKSNVSNEDIENFVSAIAKLNDTAAAAAATNPTNLVSFESRDNYQHINDSTTGNNNDQSSKDHDYIRRPSTDENRKQHIPGSKKALANESDEEEYTDDETTDESEFSKNSTDTSSNESERESNMESDNDPNFKLPKTSSGRVVETDQKSSTKKTSLVTNKKQIKRLKENKLNKVTGGNSNKRGNKNLKNKIKKPRDGATGPVMKQQSQQQKRRKPYRTSRQGSSMSLTDMQTSEIQKAKNDNDEHEPVQCLGPECVNAAMLNSKYCSHECGMKLAKKRLIAYMRSRFNDLSQQQSSDSDKLNTGELEKINAEMEKLKKRLVELEQRNQQLDSIIERAKFANINPNVEKDRNKSMDSNETEIYCVTCGLLCSEQNALKHMEKCYNKVESQAFFGTFFKTLIEGQSIFCDYYNSKTKMYCKRLKTMCPEHEKEKKISENEVCGYPLPSQSNILVDSENEICLAPKRSCSLHFKWEKLRRAQIDLEKLRTWLKLEELMEQKRLNEIALSQRRGLLSNMLYQTTTVNSSSTTSEENSSSNLLHASSKNAPSSSNITTTANA